MSFKGSFNRYGGYSGTRMEGLGNTNFQSGKSSWTSKPIFKFGSIIVLAIIFSLGFYFSFLNVRHSNRTIRRGDPADQQGNFLDDNLKSVEEVPRESLSPAISKGDGNLGLNAVITSTPLPSDNTSGLTSHNPSTEELLKPVFLEGEIADNSPHGGSLVNVMLEENSPRRAELLEALQLASQAESQAAGKGNLEMKGSKFLQWTLTQRQLCDIELLLNGGFSPLNTFMDRRTYESVVRNMRLSPLPEKYVVTSPIDELPVPFGHVYRPYLFPMPIALDLPASIAEGLRLGDRIALRDEYFNLIAVLTIESSNSQPLSDLIYRADKITESESVFGTTDKSHPGVSYLMDHMNEYYVSGKLEGFQLPLHFDFQPLRLTPLQVRELISDMGWRRTVAFQTRNPMHRAHIELSRLAARDAKAGVLIHPVVGMTKPGDVDYAVRVRCYQAVLASRVLSPTGYYAPNGAILSLLPLAMRMAGPKEALWHTIIRKNYGATHFVVGRDHAGVKSASGEDFYGAYDAQKLVEKHKKELGMSVQVYQEIQYVSALNSFFPDDLVPTDPTTGHRYPTLALSGTKFRGMMAKGSPIPEWFSDPGVISILRALMPPTHLRGFCIFFTGPSGGGKTTISLGLLARLQSLFPTRRVTVLDGDVVRTHLSKGLGFSLQDRVANVARIGFVAAEAVRHGGIVLAAPIAPVDLGREVARKAVEAVGGGFFAVHAATSLATCAKRDVKGLYSSSGYGSTRVVDLAVPNEWENARQLSGNFSLENEGNPITGDNEDFILQSIVEAIEADEARSLLESQLKSAQLEAPFAVNEPNVAGGVAPSSINKLGGDKGKLKIPSDDVSVNEIDTNSVKKLGGDKGKLKIPTDDVSVNDIDTNSVKKLGGDKGKLKIAEITEVDEMEESHNPGDNVPKPAPTPKKVLLGAKPVDVVPVESEVETSESTVIKEKTPALPNNGNIGTEEASEEVLKSEETAEVPKKKKNKKNKKSKQVVQEAEEEEKSVGSLTQKHVQQEIISTFAIQNDLSGVSHPYEYPSAPSIVIPTEHVPVEDAVSSIIAMLVSTGFVRLPENTPPTDFPSDLSPAETAIARSLNSFEVLQKDEKKLASIVEHAKSGSNGMDSTPELDLLVKEVPHIPASLLSVGLLDIFPGSSVAVTAASQGNQASINEFLASLHSSEVPERMIGGQDHPLHTLEGFHSDPTSFFCKNGWDEIPLRSGVTTFAGLPMKGSVFRYLTDTAEVAASGPEKGGWLNSLHVLESASVPTRVIVLLAPPSVVNSLAILLKVAPMELPSGSTSVAIDAFSVLHPRFLLQAHRAAVNASHASAPLPLGHLDVGPEVSPFYLEDAAGFSALKKAVFEALVADEHESVALRLSTSSIGDFTPSLIGLKGEVALHLAYDLWTAMRWSKASSQPTTHLVLAPQLAGSGVLHHMMLLDPCLSVLALQSPSISLNNGAQNKPEGNEDTKFRSSLEAELSDLSAFSGRVRNAEVPARAWASLVDISVDSPSQPKEQLLSEIASTLLQ